MWRQFDTVGPQSPRGVRARFCGPSHSAPTVALTWKGWQIRMNCLKSVTPSSTKKQMEHNQPDITDLRIFCAAVRYSSFSAAATHLGITPTYVSKRIAGLERQLGIMLFRRTTRHVQISDHGELVYTWARRVLDDLNAMSEEISASKASLYGPLRISTSLRLGRNHVAPALSVLKERIRHLKFGLSSWTIA